MTQTTTAPAHSRGRRRAQGAARRRARALPGPQPVPDDRRARRRRAARAALAADVPAGVGPRARRQLRGAVAGARGGRRGRAAPGAGRRLRRLRAPARRAPDAAAAAAVRGQRLRRPGAAHGDRLPGRGPADPRATGLLDRGCGVPDGRAARAPARRDDARHPPAPSGRCGARHRCRTAGPAAGERPAAGGGARAGRGVRDGHRRRPVGPGQRGAGAPRARAGLLARHDARDERGVPRLRRERWLRRRALVDGAGLVLALRVRQARPRCSGSATAPRPGRDGGSDESSRCRTTSRCSTSAGSRPTRTPAGPAGGCPPRRSGRRPRRGTRGRRRSGDTRGGRRPRPGARQPRPAAPPARPRRVVPGRHRTVRCAAAAR